VVGDVAAAGLLGSETFAPNLKLLFIDGMTQRGEQLTLVAEDFQQITVRNPRGGIAVDAIAVIGRLVAGGRAAVCLVEGEEDLLVLPLILEVAPGSLVAYGQPPVTDLGAGEGGVPAGLVVIEVTPEVQARARELLARMTLQNSPL
jgi:uncharacterized protein (UPF0218 family)